MDELVFTALEYAATCHRGQYRKGTRIPYIVHPTSMVRFLARLGAPAELLAAAALHDVVEDTEATLEEVRERFGERVADLVESATEKDKSQSWRERKETAISAAQATDDPELLVLKCVDRLDNLSDIREDRELVGELIWDRFKADKVSQVWYYGTLTQIFNEKLAGTMYQPLAQEMNAVYQAVFGDQH